MDGNVTYVQPFGDMGKSKQKIPIRHTQFNGRKKEKKTRNKIIENTGTENIKIAQKIYTSAYNGRMAPKIIELRIRESETSKGNNIFGANDENIPDWILDTGYK